MCKAVTHTTPEIQSNVQFQYILNYKKTIHNELLIEELVQNICQNQTTEDIVVHIDSDTSDFVEQIMDRSQKSRTSVKTLLNYDSIQFQLPVIWERPSIHMVFLLNTSRFDELNKNHLKATDAVIFICHNYYRICRDDFDNDVGELEKHFLKDSTFLSAVSKTLVIEFSENRLRLYEVCYYCGAKAGSLLKRYDVDAQSHLPLHKSDLIFEIKRLMKKKIWNFNGHILKIGFPHGGKNFQCINPRNLSSLEDAMVVSCELPPENLEGNMFKEVLKRLNFSYVLLNFEHSHGSNRENLVNFVNQSKLDLAVGSISITAYRWEKVDFSYLLVEDRCKVLYNTQGTFIKEGRPFMYFTPVAEG